MVVDAKFHCSKAVYCSCPAMQAIEPGSVTEPIPQWPLKTAQTHGSYRMRAIKLLAISALLATPLATVAHAEQKPKAAPTAQQASDAKKQGEKAGAAAKDAAKPQTAPAAAPQKK